MLHSGEIRWFFRGGLPDEARDWFDCGSLFRAEQPRVDDYLLLPGCRTTSVKVRGGRLEVKALTRASEAVDFDCGVAGYRDTWVKWSSNDGDIERVRALILRAEDQWLTVEKVRLLRLIALDSGDPVKVRPGEAKYRRGCQVELTAIRVWPRESVPANAAQWWSLSFEAFNDPATVLEDLGSAVEFFFREPPPVALTLENSMSYPAWIAKA